MKSVALLVAMAILVTLGLYIYGASVEPDQTIIVQEAQNVRK